MSFKPGDKAVYAKPGSHYYGSVVTIAEPLAVRPVNTRMARSQGKRWPQYEPRTCYIVEAPWLPRPAACEPQHLRPLPPRQNRTA